MLNAALDIDVIGTNSAAFGLKDAVHSEWFKMLCSLFMLCNHTCIFDEGLGYASRPERELNRSIGTPFLKTQSSSITSRS